MYNTNYDELGRFSIYSDGTNTYFSINENVFHRPEYKVERDTNGVFRLREMKPRTLAEHGG